MIHVKDIAWKIILTEKCLSIGALLLKKVVQLCNFDVLWDRKEKSGNCLSLSLLHGVGYGCWVRLPTVWIGMLPIDFPSL